MQMSKINRLNKITDPLRTMIKHIEHGARI